MCFVFLVTEVERSRAEIACGQRRDTGLQLSSRYVRLSLTISLSCCAAKHQNISEQHAYGTEH